MRTKTPKGSDSVDAKKPRPRPTYVKNEVAASADLPYAACTSHKTRVVPCLPQIYPLIASGLMG